LASWRSRATNAHVVLGAELGWSVAIVVRGPEPVSGRHPSATSGAANPPEPERPSVAPTSFVRAIPPHAISPKQTIVLVADQASSGEKAFVCIVTSTTRQRLDCIAGAARSGRQ
jgi:hypothetical protein